MNVQTTETKTISLKDVSKKFRRKELYKNVNIDILPGKVYLLVGANGSGKSTLLNMILEFLKPSTGKILFGDVKIGGYTNVVPFFDYLTVRENVEYFRDNIDDDILKSSFEAFSVYDYIDKDMGRCSQGMRQKALVSFCLAKKDDVIILDEPTSALDFNNRTIFFNLIAKLKGENKTIIVSTNTVSNEFINFSDFIIGIQNQKVNVFEREKLEHFWVVTFENDDSRENFIKDYKSDYITCNGKFIFIEDEFFKDVPKSSLLDKYEINSFRKEYKLGDLNEK